MSRRKRRGAGGYYRGDKFIAITWGGKISDRLRSEEVKSKRLVKYVCEGCGKECEGYSKGQRFCGWACRHKVQYTDLDGLAKKVRVLGANLLMGQGKTAILTEMVGSAIGSPCLYCGTPLSLSNVTIDHKEPYRSNDARRNKAENKAIRLYMDRPENLHVVCAKCNTLKGAMHHEQFVRFVDFLDSDPDMKRVVLARMGQSNLLWNKKRAAMRGGR